MRVRVPRGPALRRPDVWPPGDLALQIAYQRLKHLDARPTTKVLRMLTEPWRPYRGAAAVFLWHLRSSLVAIVFQMAGGLRASMHYCGCASIADMHERAEFVEISAAGMRESHVHDVQITKEAPNYRTE